MKRQAIPQIMQPLAPHEVSSHVKGIHGWLTEEEGTLLYHLAKKCRKGVIVEIGSWMGKSTLWLGHGSRAGANTPIYAIDPHTGCKDSEALVGKKDTYSVFITNIRRAELTDLVNPVVKTSADAAKVFQQPVEMIFIDGAHEYDAVLEDFLLWFPKVVSGGYMVFHDVAWSDARAVFKQKVLKSRKFRHVRILGNIGVAQKTTATPLLEYLRNHLYYQYLNIRDGFIHFASRHFPKGIKDFGNRILLSQRS